MSDDRMTAAELRDALAGMPADAPVRLSANGTSAWARRAEHNDATGLVTVHGGPR